MTADGLKEPDWECLRTGRPSASDAAAHDDAPETSESVDPNDADERASRDDGTRPHASDLLQPDWEAIAVAQRLRRRLPPRAHDAAPASGDVCPSRRSGDLIHPDWDCIARRAERRH
jgi:hypothetical protein